MTSRQDPAEFDRAVRLYIYFHFATVGRPPSAQDAARTLSRSLADVEESFRRLAAGRVMVLGPGTLDIRMANPLSAVPTPFRVETIGRWWFGNCIWDALGVIAMFGGTGRVVTECGDCGAPMYVTVDDNEIVESKGIIHFALPAPHWWDDIIFT